MYTRKWTRMSYFDSIKMFKKYGLIDSYEPFQRGFHLFPVHKYERELVNFKHDPKNKEHKEQIKQDQKLIKNLFQKYPDLKYEPINQIQEGTPLIEKNQSLRFIEKQKQLMKNGYSEQKAFQLTELQFQNRIQKKIDSLQITENLAASNRARSFMNYYQQQAEFESRLKVLRMQRDLQSFEEAKAQAKKEIFEDNENDNILDQQKSQEEQDSIYERVLYKIKNVGQKPQNNKEVEQNEDISEQFVTKTQNMFQKYYERAANADKLSGLTDQEIKNQIRDSPIKIKKRSKQLIQKLEKLGVQISEDGKLDLSNVPYPNVRKELEQNPQVKMVLLQQLLDFEFPHKDHLQQKANQMKQRLSVVESELELAQSENESQLKKLQSQNQLQQQENNKETNEDGKEANQQQELDDSQDIQQTKNAFLHDSEFPMLNLETNSYKLFETYQERQLRIEAKYLQMKIKQIEEEQFADEAELQSQQQQSQLLDETVQKLRRLKFRIEQKNLQSAKQLLFEEHDVYDKQELLIDQDLPYEQLQQYLNTPRDQRVKGEEDEIIDMKIQKMIQPKVVKEDLVEPYDKLYEHKLFDKDSFEKSYEQSAKQKKDQSLWEQSNKGKSQLESDFLSQKGEEVDLGPKNKSKTKKEDRKQLLDFIKKANQKKQKVGKVTAKIAEVRQAKKDSKKKK